MSSSGTYFVATTTVTSGPDLGADALVGGADRRQATRAITPCTPRGSPVRRCEKKSSGLQDVQRSKRSTLVDAGRAQRPLGRRPEVEACGRAARRRRTRRERLRDLRPDLVAARADRRADRGGLDAAAERAHALGDDPGEQTAPARVQDGDGRPAAVHARERDRQAVGRHREHGQVRLVRPEAVARLAARARHAPVHDCAECTCRLSASRSSRAADLAQSRRRFSSTRSTSSPVSRPRLSESYGPSLTPPSRVEKTTSYGPGGVPADHAAAPRGAGEQQLARRCGSGSSTTSSSRSASVRPSCGPSREAERDQVVAVDGEVGEPVRAASSSDSTSCAEPSASARHARAAARSLAAQVGRLVREQVEREPVAVAGEEAARIRRGVRVGELLEHVLAHDPGRRACAAWPGSAAAAARARRCCAPSSAWSAPSRSACGLPRSCSSAASRTSSDAPASAAAWTTVKRARRASGAGG